MILSCAYLLVIFNPLNIAREDVVEASLSFPGGMPKAVHVTGPDGKEVPAHIANGKVYLLRKGAVDWLCSLRCATRGSRRHRRITARDGALAPISQTRELTLTGNEGTVQ